MHHGSDIIVGNVSAKANNWRVSTTIVVDLEYVLNKQIVSIINLLI